MKDINIVEVLKNSESHALQFTLNLSGLEFRKLDLSSVLQRMKTLILSNCSLRDFPLETFLPNLETLDLSFNLISEIRSGLRFTPNVHHLDLCGNLIRKFESISGIFTHLKAVKSLNLLLNDIRKHHGYKMHLIKTLPHLKELDECSLESELVFL